MQVTRLLALVSCAVFVASIFPAGASAQHDMGAMIGETDNTVVLYDPPQDVQLAIASRANGPTENASAQGSNFDHLDILKVKFGDETDADFKITLFLKTLAPPQGLPGFPSRAVMFQYGQVHWRVAVNACQTQNPQPGQVPTAPPLAGCLSYGDGSARGYRNFKTVVVEADASNNAYVFTIPKPLLFDENRVPLRFGDTLTGLSAATSQTFATTNFLPTDPLGGVYAFDNAPNAGVSQTNFIISKGSHGHGHFALSSDLPVRVSNGEATTIVYKVTLFNHALEDMTATVTTKNVRPDWTVQTPALIKIKKQSNITVPIVLAMPFTHEHGKTVTFTVNAQSVEDPASFADLDLGVWWTEVPQPSAHHNGELWFHSSPFSTPAPFNTVFTGEQGWVNAIETDPDPDANDGNIPAYQNQGANCVFSGNVGSCGTPPAQIVSWFFPLSPGLLIGLDFNTGKTATVIADFLPQVPATQATLTAKILYCDPGGKAAKSTQGGVGGQGQQSATICQGQQNYKTVLAQGQASNTLSYNSPAHFEVQAAVTPDADYLPYKTNANIGIELDMTTNTPQTLFGGGQPTIQFIPKSSHVYMPLLEYHDPVDSEFEKLGSLHLAQLSGFEKKVNPGRTTLFQFNLTNKGSPSKILVDLQGINVEWARLVTPQSFTLKSNETTPITVAVMAPGDAQDTERADLFVSARNPDDESIIAVSQMRATVVVGQDIPDEASALEVHKAKKSPGPEVVLELGVIAALVAVVELRRRRA